MTEQTTLPAKTRAEPAVPAVFTRLRDEIDRLFDDFSFARPSRGIFAFPAIAELTPAMELTEKKDHYSLSVELPGMEEKDIDIECADGVLTISGEKTGNPRRRLTAIWSRSAATVRSSAS